MTSSTLLLLVEDDPVISEILEDALIESGFEIVKSQNGAEALEEIEADTSRFRGIITDIQLGGKIDGWAIARRAREIIPSTPIVYMSGDSGHEWASKGVPGSVMLIKPFAPAQVVTAVSTLVTEAEMRALPPG